MTEHTTHKCDEWEWDEFKKKPGNLPYVAHRGGKKPKQIGRKYENKYLNYEFTPAIWKNIKLRNIIVLNIIAVEYVSHIISVFVNCVRPSRNRFTAINFTNYSDI